MYNTMTDWELIVKIKEDDDKALHAMFDKYFRLFMKQKAHLERTCRELGLSPDTGNYLGIVYQTFLNAMNTVNLERIPEPKEKWGAWVLINGYLRSKNRDIIAALIKDNKNQMPLNEGNNTESLAMVKPVATGIAKVASTEDDYLRKEATTPFWEAVESSFSSLTDQQKVIFNKLHEGLKKNTICKDLGITMPEYNKDLRIIQDLLKLQFKSKLHTMDTSEIRQQMYV